MSFNNFVELQDLIRSYNSKSILEIGTRICYKIFYSQNNSDPLIRLSDNAKRGYAIRIMLLASMGNPYRRKNIDEKTFHTYIDDYYNFENHTIAYPNVLDQEAETIFRCIQTWEVKEKSKVRNWLLKLSDIFDITVIRQYIQIVNRSLDNWAELILQTHNNPNVCVEPDNQGHNYQHLADIQLL